MAHLTSDCPRCGAMSITFDCDAAANVGVLYNWCDLYEAFCVCRRCGKTTVFKLQLRGSQYRDTCKDRNFWQSTAGLDSFFLEDGYVSTSDREVGQPPEHLPAEIEEAFTEGLKCLALQCFNASGTMFRLCLDRATRSFLPEPSAAGDQPNSKQRRDLGLRLPWLFDHDKLPQALRDLASAVKEDGNDGAHAGNLTKADAEDLLDFATALLERLYTEPARLRLAQERRAARRGGEAPVAAH